MFNLRYSREIALKELSVEGYETIAKASVCVVGAGATGSPVSDLFVRAGVGKLRLIDPDTVDISNLHRQILYSESDVGRKKVEASRDRLNSINGGCLIDPVDVLLDGNNVEELLGNCDIVLDGTDNMEARRVINRYCVEKKIPWIFIASIGTVAQVKAVIPGETSCLECFVEDGAEFSMSCAETGVLASSPIMASSMAWTMATRILMGEKEEGELFYLDPWNHVWEKVMIKRNPKCRTCSKL